MSNFSKSFGLTFINDDHFFASVAIFQTGTIFETDKDNRLYFVVEGECRLCLPEDDDENSSEGGAMAPLPGGGIVGTDEGALAGRDLPGRGLGGPPSLLYNAQTITRLGPGNFFGEGCLFPDLRRDWIVEAMSEVKLYFISRGDVLNNVDRTSQDIIRREAEFKVLYYDGRCRGRLNRPVSIHSRHR